MSKRRRSFTPCRTSDKHPYGTQQAALEALHRIRAENAPHRDKLPVRTYQCHCGRWHLTSMLLASQSPAEPP